MGERTTISWCEHTFNPWIGCTRISPACDGCYAANLMETRLGRVVWGGPGKGAGTRARTSESNWHQPYRWDRRAKQTGTRPFVFCASLADVFDNEVPAEWVADLFTLFSETPNLVWLLLTKRPQNIVSTMFRAAGQRKAPRNVAFGTTVEDQRRANTNIPALAVAKILTNPLFTFLSCEPLLEQIYIRDIPISREMHKAVPYLDWQERFDPLHPEAELWNVEWVITGGETDQGAHKARPTHPAAFRSLRDQCRDSSAVLHHKQNGEWQDEAEASGDGERFVFPDCTAVRKVGKRRSGRAIDGVVYDARPKVLELA